MENKVKLSVIIPAYNAEKTIKKCLESIIENDFKDREIIVINDGSNDSTEEIVQELMIDNTDIKIINKINAGLPQARKTGVENSVGELITFIDSDDFVDKDFFSKHIAEFKDDVDIVASGICKDGKKIIREFYNKRLDLNKVEALYYLNERAAVYTSMCNKVFRRKLLLNIKFPTGNFVGEDYLTIVQLIEKSDKIISIPYCGYHYVQTTQSMSRCGYDEKKYKSFVLYKKVNEKLVKKYPELKESIDNYMILEYMAIAISMGNNKNYDYRVLRYIKKFIHANLTAYLKDKNINFIYKICAVFSSISIRLFIRNVIFAKKIIKQ